MRFRGAWMVLVVLCASRVEAQSTAAIGLTLDPSVRDAGMADAAVASFWTNGEASWCNPTLASDRRSQHSGTMQCSDHLVAPRYRLLILLQARVSTPIGTSLYSHSVPLP